MELATTRGLNTRVGTNRLSDKMTSRVKRRPSNPGVLQSPFEDLAELLETSWDEHRVLQNFRLRFMSGMPYTSLLGNVIVAVNPCKNLVEVYDRDMQVCPAGATPARMSDRSLGTEIVYHTDICSPSSLFLPFLKFCL